MQLTVPVPVAAQPSSYRAWLKNLMAERLARNPRLSLRSFAKTSGVAVSTLSMALSGKTNLSPTKALTIARRLGLPEHESERFILLVQYENETNPDFKEVLGRKLSAQSEGLPPAHDIDVDRFKMIADWYHLPLLQMVGHSKLPQTPAKMAARLGISPIEAETALSRLERLGLVVSDKKGALKCTKSRIVFRSPTPSEALRSFHRQMLEKTIASLETQTPREKWIGTETLAFDPQQLDAAGALLEECFQKVCGLAATSKHRSEIYHLATQFFRLTTPVKAPKGAKK
jgi:uncharacterized protein (TIGR02147 family)